MKALSVLNPWAWLLATGAKRFETRSWPTDFRGRFAIHASKGFSRKFEQLCFSDPFDRAIFGGLEFDDVPKRMDKLKESCGCVLAVAELTGCFAVEEILHTLSTQEKCFGDYSAGRFAWRVENVKVLPRPIAAVGALGLWNWVDRSGVVTADGFLAKGVKR